MKKVTKKNLYLIILLIVIVNIFYPDVALENRLTCFTLISVPILIILILVFKKCLMLKRQYKYFSIYSFLQLLWVVLGYYDNIFIHPLNVLMFLVTISFFNSCYFILLYIELTMQKRNESEKKRGIK